jgi:hypothetical protein
VEGEVGIRRKVDYSVTSADDIVGIVMQNADDLPRLKNSRCRLLECTVGFPI